MSASKNDIRRWLNEVPPGTAHVLIKRDTFNNENYPAYTTEHHNLDYHFERAQSRDWEKIDEVYSLTGKHSIEDQLAAYRAWNLD